MISNLYSHPLPASRTGALYNAFSYPTKISPESIAIFIASHTKPGETVLDTFGGSGTTGLAALLCDAPTEAMKMMAKKMGVKPEWGPRHAEIFDIGVLGSFIGSTLCQPPSSDDFIKSIELLFQKAANAVGWMYEAKDNDGVTGQLRHIVWSDVICCPFCKSEFPFFDVCVQFDPVDFLESFRCPSCHSNVESKSCEKVCEKITDGLTGLISLQKKRVPVKLYGQTGTRKWDRPVSEHDIELIRKINEIPFPSHSPIRKVVFGDLYRAGYHKGISHLHHFYTKRNFYVISVLWEMSIEFDEKIRNAIKLLILSYNASHSTLMTRVVAKKNQKDFVLTGAQSGVLYISSLPVEKNILLGLKRKANSFEKAFCLIRNSSSTVRVRNVSSENLPLLDGSIDYVFTDPPFGDYIPYAELNQINELWLDSVTDRSKEIIVSKAQNRDVLEYEKMMGNVFCEISRVLKQEGKATVVFHSAKSEIWQALTNSYTKSGMGVVHTSVLDKLQSSFKQTNSTISVKGDPLLLLEKCKVEYVLSHITSFSVMLEVINDLELLSSKGMTVERLYSLFINRCLERSIKIDVDAAVFYKHASVSLSDL